MAPYATGVTTLAALVFLLPGLTLAVAMSAAQTTVASTPPKNAIVQIASPLSFEFKPSYDLPIGDSATCFSSGGSAGFGLEYRLPSSPFYILGGLQYCYAPVQAATSISVASSVISGEVRSA